MVKVKKQDLILFIANIILIIVIIFQTIDSTKEPEVMPISKYLSINHQNFSINDNPLFSDNLFGKDFQNNKLVFAGESHGTVINYDLMFALYKHLHENYGYKYLLYEYGFATTALLNKYMHTGDKSILDYVFSEIEGSYFHCYEHYEFWTKMYEYNKSLPTKNKAVVIGIDIEHRPKIAIKYLQDLSSDKPLTLKMSEYISNINIVVESTSYINKTTYLRNFINHVNLNESDYKKVFEEDFFDFKFVLTDLKNSIKAYDDKSNLFILREDFIYSNFIKIYKHYPKSKYFCQIGNLHVPQKNLPSKYDYFNKIAAQLNEQDSPIKDKILSILYVYYNSKKMNREDYTTPRNIINNYTFTQDYLLSKYDDADLTIFKLNGKYSPYTTADVKLHKAKKGPLTDYIQYIITIYNSKAVTRYDTYEKKK